MAPDHRYPVTHEPFISHRRRHALRTLAGAGTALVALRGHGMASSEPTASETNGPAGPELLHVSTDRKRKKGKRGPTGPTGPTGPSGTISQNEATIEILAGGNANAQATCASGQAVGGGASLSNVECDLVSSNVVGTTAWGATGKCPSDKTATMIVRVICLG